jgi:hypothetical protein
MYVLKHIFCLALSMETQAYPQLLHYIESYCQ